MNFKIKSIKNYKVITHISETNDEFFFTVHYVKKYSKLILVSLKSYRQIFKMQCLMFFSFSGKRKKIIQFCHREFFIKVSKTFPI